MEKYYLDIDEFLSGARKSSIGSDVAEKNRREYDRPITASEAMRDAGFDGEAYNETAHRAVGW